MFKRTIKDYQAFDDPYGEMASDRVDAEPRLQPHREVLIDYDWDESDHLEWVATADLDAIVDWAETIEKQ